MAVLSDSDRAVTYSRMAQELSQVRESCGLTKAQLRAAIDAADVWANDNAAAYNSALPVAARNILTSAQKARLLSYVIQKRWEVG